MGWESIGVIRFYLGLLLQGQTRITKLKRAYNSLIFGCAGLGWNTNLYEIMGWESFDVVRFDLGPLIRGQARIAKSQRAYKSFFLVPEVCNVKPSYKKSYARSDQI